MRVWETVQTIPGETEAQRKGAAPWPSSAVVVELVLRAGGHPVSPPPLGPHFSPRSINAL